MIQTLNDMDIPPSHIMQLSGHKNVQSVNDYSHISQKQQKRMSRISSGSISMVQTETHPLVETTKQQSSTPTAVGLLSGVLSTEEISLSISTRPHLQQKIINNKFINEKKAYLTLRTRTTRPTLGP